MMLLQSRANESNANTSMEQSTEAEAGSSVINKIRNMNLDLQDKIQNVGTNVTTIKDCLDSVKSDVAGLGYRIWEAENKSVRT